MAAAMLLHAHWAPPPLDGKGGRRHRSLSCISHLHQASFLRLLPPSPSSRFLAGAQKRGAAAPEENQLAKRAQQSALWAAEAAYILWLFLLPYAPGDPVWAISSNTVNDLVGLSINFFFILPLVNSVVTMSCIGVLIVSNVLVVLLGRVVGIHVIQAPVLHPMAEGLFNFVIGWTFLFAPLLFTDHRRGRYKGSLDLLWGFQMFLTNTFLIPYMAIRLNDMNIEDEQSPPKPTQLGLLMTNGAQFIGLIGGIVCLISALWALVGRADGGFGDVSDRWQFLVGYIRSERLAYAFIWDILLYSIFQPWLIGDNLQNLKSGNEGLVSVMRYVPVLGMVAYLLCLDNEKDF